METLLAASWLPQCPGHGSPQVPLCGALMSFRMVARIRCSTLPRSFCATGVTPLERSSRDAAAATGVLEAVEVKNTCPFQQVAWVTASGKRRTSYVLIDRGPRSEARVCASVCVTDVSTSLLEPFWAPVEGSIEKCLHQFSHTYRRDRSTLGDVTSQILPQVPVYWVAQLQLEMLASGCGTVLLVSRSATQVRLESSPGTVGRGRFTYAVKAQGLDCLGLDLLKSSRLLGEGMRRYMVSNHSAVFAYSLYRDCAGHQPVPHGAG